MAWRVWKRLKMEAGEPVKEENKTISHALDVQPSNARKLDLHWHKWGLVGNRMSCIMRHGTNV